MHPRFRVVVGLAVAVATVRPAPSRAGEPAATAALDETTFLQRVRDASPRTRALGARARAAAAEVALAGVLPNPSVSYEREALPSLTSIDNFFRLGWTVDPSGRRGLATRAARAGADAELHGVGRDEQLLLAEARLAYLDAVYARERMTRLDAARTSLGGLVDTLQSRARQGETAGYDADRAALELSTLDDDRVTARRTLELAQLRLGALLGEPATPYAASDALTLPVLVALPAGGEPTRRDVDAARARATQADHELAAARLRWVPKLELLGGLMVSTQQNGDGLGYVIGIGGELPVFDRGGAAASRARASAKRWRAEADALRNDARGELARAHRELELLLEQANAYFAGPVTRAADLERRAASAYREGDRPILELLDVQRTTRQVSLRALELVYEARRAEIALDRARGRNQ